MSDWLTDLRFGLRMARKRPGTSALAVIALALGIGLTSTMFGIVQGAFLRGLPFDGPSSIVYLGRTQSDRARNGSGPASMDDFLDWRERQQSFEALAAFAQDITSINLSSAAQRAKVARVTSNAFGLLRVAPQLGRDFTEGDGQPGAARVAMLSDRIWKTAFSGDPAAIGRTIRVGGTTVTVVGVMPAGFGFPDVDDLWMPLTVSRPSQWGSGERIEVFGRLAKGASIARASADLQTIAAASAAAHVENRGVGVEVTPYIRHFLAAPVIDTLTAMLGAVFGVLLIACANVASLQLARAAERSREIAVRTALGASRARVVRQMLIEGLVLSSAGAILGLALAYAGTSFFMRAVVDTGPPFWLDVRIDATVVAFIVLLAAVAAVAASVLPALRVTRQDVSTVLKDEGRAGTGLQVGRLSNTLVILEVLVSCCLLVVSGLMIKSVVTISRLQYPYSTRDVLVAPLLIEERLAPTTEDSRRLAERLEAALASAGLPRDVSLASGAPEESFGRAVAIEDRTYAKSSDRTSARYLAVTPRYLDVLRVKMNRGRSFASSDSASAPPVAIVTDDFAREYFADRDPIGARIQVGDETVWRSVVGVVPSLVRAAPARDTAIGTVLVPLAQAPTRQLTVFASAPGEPSSLAPAVRRAVTSVDQDLVPMSVSSLAEAYWSNTWAFRVFGALFLSFGLSALVLASAGLYGVMAFSVRRRTQEIGVRLALGANRGRVVRMVVWQGMSRVGLGILLGLVPAWLLGGLMKALLFGVTPADPLVFGVTVGVLVMSGFAASFVPARRAASVDPMTALRTD